MKASLLVHLLSLCWPPGLCSDFLEGASPHKTGLLITGGHGKGQWAAAVPTSVEFWAPDSGLNCSLPDLPRDMAQHTVDEAEGRVLACQEDSCLELTPAGWVQWRETLYSRSSHTSAVTPQGLMLMGGRSSETSTELLALDGEGSVGTFSLESPRSSHCSIQVSATAVVLTGGVDWSSMKLVTEYSGLGEQVATRDLASLLEGRFQHACGSYTVGDSQMLIVTGGRVSNPTWPFTASTEVLDFSSPEASWRSAASLPQQRAGLSGARLGATFNVAGGTDPWGPGPSTEIFAWDPVAESWAQAGHLTTARTYMAVTEVALSTLDYFC